MMGAQAEDADHLRGVPTAPKHKERFRTRIASSCASLLNPSERHGERTERKQFAHDGVCRGRHCFFGPGDETIPESSPSM